MKNYIGIDLGTTNSVICSYDGTNVRIWKSPEQNDVTPSAIYVDRRGNRYYGAKAYNQAPYNPNNSATLFKRFMGTSTKIELEAAHVSLTPEECSAEILKVLFGYLPEEIRNDPETATVITVPAAFNQMKKDATLQAAKMAGIGKVALMQEPVAAVMSVMRSTNVDGLFLIYDLGGGTFDVSIAENSRGKVNLLAHGGIEMCGGRDIDRMIFNQIVIPWLRSNFDLPDDLLVNPKYKTFCRVAQWASEQAKVELSANETSTIALSEGEARTTDDAGNELYLDIDISRDVVDKLITDLVSETVKATRQTMEKAGLTSNDLERIVFVGGPTNYKPLRDRVAQELALPVDINVNPMTAVAEGASIFAESIDWSTESHHRKESNVTTDMHNDISLRYTARVTGANARVMCVMGREYPGYTISITCLDTGWSSGNARLENNAIITLPLEKNGENRFAVKVLDRYGNAVSIGVSEITITKTLATVGAIPASHSIGMEVIERLGGNPVLDFLVNEGDPLPQRGTKLLKAAQTLKAGSNDSINIKLWEGNIQDPITDNRFIGILKISGTDFISGVIPAGADIECEYEVSDSGTISLEVSIPSIGASFNNKNFYSRQEGQLDLEDVDSIAEQGQQVVDRIDRMSQRVDDPRLREAKKKADKAATIDSMPEQDIEDVQRASNELLEAKKMLNQVRQENLKAIRQMDLDSCIAYFNENVRKYASDAEIQSFENLSRSAQRSIDRNDSDFENILENMRTKNAAVLLQQDWFIVDIYRVYTASSSGYIDQSQYYKLKEMGDRALRNNDMDTLRKALVGLAGIRVNDRSDEAMFDVANVIRG